AMAAYRRACRLRQAESSMPPSGEAPSVLFGLGVTASLATDRPKRGAHRIHLAAQTADATRSWSIELSKGRRTRDAEEEVASHLALTLLAEVCGFGVDPFAGLSLFADERLARRATIAPDAWRDLLAGRISRTSVRDGFVDSGDEPRAI